MIWRDLKVRYKQTVLGVTWAILQPFLKMVVFSIFFGELAKVPTDNGIPYPIFSYAALLPFTLFTKALNDASRSLVGHQNMVTKIYFPRLILPLSSVLGRRGGLCPGVHCAHRVDDLLLGHRWFSFHSSMLPGSGCRSSSCWRW